MSKTETNPIDHVQRQFIQGIDKDGLEHNVFVRAGAGAGKTTCIIDRIMNLMLVKGLNPQKIAIVTYTKRAASELATRVRLRLEQLLTESEDDEEQVKLATIMDNLNQANIGTVHSFCRTILTEYPIEFRVDPSSKIADERAKTILRTEAKRLFYLRAAERPDSFKDQWIAWDQLLASKFEVVEKGTIFRIFEELSGNRELTPVPLPFTAGISEDSLIRSIAAGVTELAKDVFVTLDVECKKQTDKLFLLLPEIHEKLLSMGIQRDTNVTPGQVTEHLARLASLFPTKVGAKGNYQSPKIIEDYKARVNELKDLLASLQRLRDIRAYNLVIEIFPAYAQSYKQTKQDYGLIDFEDCLNLLSNGLRDNSALRHLLQKRFDAIIVDEFQDSDPLQSEILFHLAGNLDKTGLNWEEQQLSPSKLTFVGDPKQSIFGFSRASIEIYLRVMELIANSDEKSQISLSTNFRSNGRIIEFVNQVFSKLLQPSEEHPNSQPKYEPMAAAAQNSAIDKQDVQVLNLKLTHELDESVPHETKKHGESQIPKAHYVREREAWLVGHYLKDAVSRGEFEYGDVLVLFRTKSAMAIYENNFQLLGIPVINTASIDFLQKSEAQFLALMAGFLSRPNETHFLYAILVAEYLGFNDHEALNIIREMRNNRPNMSDFPPVVIELLTISKSGGPLYERLYMAASAIGLFALESAGFGKEIADAAVNVCELIRIELETVGFDENKVVSSLLASAQLDSDTYKKRDDDDDLQQSKLQLQVFASSKVQLMTMHSAKGLESKVVILAGPESDRLERIDTIINRKNREIIVNSQKIGEMQPKQLQAIEIDFQREVAYRSAEETRVLYVAMTRAEQKLLLLNNRDAKCGSFFSGLYNLPEFSDLDSINLDLDESYYGRDKLKPSPFGTAPSISNRDEFLDLARDATEKIATQRGTSVAVTTQLRERAKKLFGAHKGAQDRGAEIGTALHELMEWLCHRIRVETVTTEDLDNQVMAKNESFEFPEEVIKSMKQCLIKFLGSETCRQIVDAEAIQTEVSFQVLDEVHGVIDLLYKDSRGIHIIDWKSDHLDDDERSKDVRAYYKDQILYYERALEKILGEKLATAECVYLFD